MDDRDCSGDMITDDSDTMDIISAAEIKEELLDDADTDAANVDSQLSDVETEDDDVIIVDAEKTMQYLSGSVSIGSRYG